MKVTTEGRSAATGQSIERAAFRISEFCEWLGISPATYFKFARLGQIKSVRIGRRVLIPMDEALRIKSEGLR